MIFSKNNGQVITNNMSQIRGVKNPFVAKESNITNQSLIQDDAVQEMRLSMIGRVMNSRKCSHCPK